MSAFVDDEGEINNTPYQPTRKPSTLRDKTTSASLVAEHKCGINSVNGSYYYQSVSQPASPPSSGSRVPHHKTHRKRICHTAHNRRKRTTASNGWRKKVTLNSYKTRARGCCASIRRTSSGPGQARPDQTQATYQTPSPAITNHQPNQQPARDRGRYTISRYQQFCCPSFIRTCFALLCGAEPKQCSPS